jgi:hypothetical protein
MQGPLNTTAYRQLLLLQRRIHEYTRAIAREYGRDNVPSDHPLWTSDYNYLAIAPIRRGLLVEYFGDTHDDPFQWTLDCLGNQSVANEISSLAFSGPDEGANGLREWNFAALLDSGVTFPQLRSLSVKPTEPEHHNMSMIQGSGAIMSEGGDIARFAAKAPYLSELTVPNAPDVSFFELPLAHLTSLRVGGGHDTQKFIDNLSSTKNLPSLGLLDFTESTELQFTWAKNRAEGSVTSFTSYENFFRNTVCTSLHTFRLRNSCLTLSELQALKSLRPKLQLQVIQATTGGYVSHFERNVFPWKHLIQPDPGLP